MGMIIVSVRYGYGHFKYQMLLFAKNMQPQASSTGTYPRPRLDSSSRTMAKDKPAQWVVIHATLYFLRRKRDTFYYVNTLLGHWSTI